MLTCPNCGTESPDAFKFCPACATALGEQTPPREFRKTVTVVFSDLRGSTSIGESTDPESLRNLMARYYERMRGVLERHGGSVEKMIGDAVMGVFGIPTLHEDDALRAVRAADEMRHELAALNDELEAESGVRLQARTGVNTGEVFTGDATGGFMTGGVTGDTVNVAARLEQAAPPGEVLIGKPTWELVRDAVEVEAVEPLELKGKAERVPAFRLVAVGDSDRGVARRNESPLVGRERQMTMLRQAYDWAVADATCQLFTVLGPAGMGKSRLVDEFLSGIEATHLLGRCIAYGDGITYWPVADVLKQIAGITDRDTAVETRAKLLAAAEGEDDAALLADRAAALLGLSDQHATPDEHAWAVRKYLESVARRGPLVVVFDDVHWGEPAFLDLIDHVIDFSREVPILVVCTARPELMDHRPGWGGGKLNATSVLLEPLSDDEAAQMVGNLVGAAIGETARRRFVEASGGNPLFVEEIVAMLIDQGALVPGDEGWVPVGDLADIAIPPTISALLAARIDRLPREEEVLLERGSIVGRVFYSGAVLALSPEPERSSVPGRLMTLVRKELTRPARSDFAGQDAYRFRSLMLRDVAYDLMPKEDRASLHEDFARWLEAAAGDRVAEYRELLGHHLEQAYRYRLQLGAPGERERELAREAGGHLAAAGLRAARRMDAHVAVGLLDRAVDLLGTEDPEAVRLQPWLGRALIDGGDFDRARSVLASAADAAAELGDDALVSEVRMAELELESLVEPDGWTERAETEARRAIEVFEAAGDGHNLSLAYGLLSDSFALRCRSAEAAEAALRAVEAAEAAGEQGGRNYASYAISLYLGPTPVDEGIRLCEDILARDSISRSVRAATMWALGGLRGMGGDVEEARRLALEGAEIDRGLGRELVSEVGPAELLGQLALLSGDPGTAEAEVRPRYERLVELGDRNFASTLAARLAEIEEELGHDEAAMALTEECERAAADDDMASQVLWRTARAKVLSKRGGHEEALALAAAAVGLVAATDYLSLQADTLVCLARIQRAAGLTAEADANRTEARQRYERKGNLLALGRL